MSLSMLRGSRSLLRTNLRMNGAIRPFSAVPDETYTDRMIKKGRPVSPHVTIYRFPIVAISSITNRVTGFMLMTYQL